MSSRNARIGKVFYVMAAVVLLAGMIISSFIYLTAEDDPDKDLLYQFEHSKRYSRDVQLYGGKVNILADDFTRRFTGLWQGKTLAFTIACLSLFVSLGIVFGARYYVSEKSDSQDRNQPLSGP